MTKKNKQYVILGLGKFGSSLAQALSDGGNEILGIDINMHIVEEFVKLKINAVQADVTDKEAMKKLGISNFDVAIVAIGENMEASILATMLLKELGISYVIAKATSEMHKKVLERIGADRVVFPEHEMGVRIATNLMNNNILDFIELSSNYSIVEIIVKEEWIDKSIGHLNLRKTEDLNIIAIKNDDTDTLISPTAEYVFKANDVIIAIVPTVVQSE